MSDYYKHTSLNCQTVKSSLLGHHSLQYSVFLTHRTHLNDYFIHYLYRACVWHIRTVFATQNMANNTPETHPIWTSGRSTHACRFNVYSVNKLVAYLFQCESSDCIRRLRSVGTKQPASTRLQLAPSSGQLVKKIFYHPEYIVVDGVYYRSFRLLVMRCAVFYIQLQLLSPLITASSYRIPHNILYHQ